MAGSLTMVDPEVKALPDQAFLHKGEYLTGEMMRIISDLDSHYSHLSLAEQRGGVINDSEKRLAAVEEKILAWDSDQSMIWDRDPEEASEYLHAVDEVRQLAQSLGSSHSKLEDGELNELLRRADTTLHVAMARLEEEFIHLLVQYQQPVEPDHMSFRSVEDDSIDGFSSASFDEEPIEGRIQSELNIHTDGFMIDLVHPSAVFDLKSIAGMMLLSNYDKICCQAYINVRKEALDECLSILRIEKWSIEEIVQMDWNLLNSKIKRWNCVMKFFIRVYLTSEKRLCDLILGDYSPSARESCFVEILKGSMLQLLTFAEAIAIGPPKLEKLFRILDMCEGLADLLPDVESLISEEYGSSILTECHEVLLRLGESVKLIFAVFKRAIQNNTSTHAFPGGGIHPLTNYVMNYIKALVDYSNTLDRVLDDQGSVEYNAALEVRIGSFRRSSPMVHHLQSVISILEVNLDGRSKLYKDDSLRNIFLMNNIYYIVQKVKDSDLRTFLEDNWIKEHNRMFRKHAVSYQRASWNSVLSFLKDEGVCNPGSSTPSRTVLKERFRNFNLSFEEVYRNQTAWSIPAVQLRDELRISISLRVLQAYRTFMGRYGGHLDSVRHRDRYIKYSPDDLEGYLLDLFEGSPKSLHYPRRK